MHAQTDNIVRWHVGFGGLASCGKLMTVGIHAQDSLSRWVLSTVFPETWHDALKHHAARASPARIITCSDILSIFISNFHHHLRGRKFNSRTECSTLPKKSILQVPPTTCLHFVPAKLGLDAQVFLVRSPAGSTRLDICSSHAFIRWVACNLLPLRRNFSFESLISQYTPSVLRMAS
ncbi:uncharacterized protein BDZ83DRAFT_305107 [Colletotrichum acutatum]|uniref:Uncharacterized protein n=1 Tax=Glomerella acutata TaxID=27357 RepID=A0AAD8XJ02_GLOAC|nr:uncharacterized protein BDZ83DRAFT_305107 [Colletotrichum acutatum]KAK1725325.1 hypothetical protein BDZ83DRAFT_305107 [Colletotrichum acutatum]